MQATPEELSQECGVDYGPTLQLLKHLQTYTTICKFDSCLAMRRYKSIHYFVGMAIGLQNNNNNNNSIDLTRRSPTNVEKSSHDFPLRSRQLSMQMMIVVIREQLLGVVSDLATVSIHPSHEWCCLHFIEKFPSRML
jgi:hypothetical protein